MRVKGFCRLALVSLFSIGISAQLQAQGFWGDDSPPPPA